MTPGKHKTRGPMQYLQQEWHMFLYLLQQHGPLGNILELSRSRLPQPLPCQLGTSRTMPSYHSTVKTRSLVSQ